MPDIDSLPDSAAAQPPAGVLRWSAHRWQRWPEPGIAFPDADQVRAGSDWISLPWIDVALVVLWLLGLVGILLLPRWEAILPITAAMIGVNMWHGRRRHAADAESGRINAENERMLTLQQRFLQDASHQLRTPITIALGHSELLAKELVDQQGKRDIEVVVGELNRLRQLSERLLLIAASAEPDFLRPEAVDLGELATEAVWRWRPTADRRWQLGQLDGATVRAERERLGLAIDALLENAVEHTRQGDSISLSVIEADGSAGARLVVEDSGAGIAPAALSHIFDRFATGSREAGRRGTGLGLALVRAVANGHGAKVAASSTLGQGSRFELILPLRPATMTIETSDIDPCRSN